MSKLYAIAEPIYTSKHIQCMNDSRLKGKTNRYGCTHHQVCVYLIITSIIYLYCDFFPSMPLFLHFATLAVLDRYFVWFVACMRSQYTHWNRINTSCTIIYIYKYILCMYHTLYCDMRIYDAVLMWTSVYHS